MSVEVFVNMCVVLVRSVSDLVRSVFMICMIMMVVVSDREIVRRCWLFVEWMLFGVGV